MAGKRPPQALIDAWEGSRIDESIHIVPRRNTDLWVSDIIYVKDSFTKGPCDVDAAEQLLKRTIYWRTVREFEEPEQTAGDRTRRSKTKDFSGRPVGWTTGSGASRKTTIAMTCAPPLPSLTIPSRLSSGLRGIGQIGSRSGGLSQASTGCNVTSDDLPSRQCSRSSLRERHKTLIRSQFRAFQWSRLRIAFDARTPLGDTFLKNGASLWHKYADASPLAFGTARRSGCDEFPDLPSAAEPYGWLYPRVRAGNSRTRLSLLDEAFLGGFSVDEWLTPWEALCVAQWTQAVLDEYIAERGEDAGSKSSASHSTWEKIVSGGAADVELLRRLVEERVAGQRIDLITPVCDAFGSNPFTMRLHEWSVHQPGVPLLKRRPGKDGTNPFTRLTYRLTPHARRILDDGMLSPDDAPPMFAGGCEVYRREPFWVRCASSDGWRLERR